MSINVDPIPGGTWLYSDRAHVLALVGTDNAGTIWSLSNTNGVEDPGLMEQDGVQADAYIDRWLGAQSVTVPVDTTTASATVSQSLADIGAHLTVWWGFHHRGLDELSDRMSGKSASDIGGLMTGYKDYADEQLGRLLTIIRAQDPGDVEHGSAAGQLAVSVGPPKHYPGTGSVRPFAVTLPNAISPLNW